MGAAATSKNMDILPHQINSLLAYSRLSSVWWLFVLGLCVLAALLFYWLRKRKLRKMGNQTREDPLQIVRQDIAALIPADHFDRKAQEDYYYQLNIKFRYFIELIYQFPATDRTFFELRQLLRKKLTLDESIVATMICFFEKSEYIKFAERDSTKEEAGSDKRQVLQWMDGMETSKIESSEKTKKGAVILNGEADANRF